jgi:hypothetical protein
MFVGSNSRKRPQSGELRTGTTDSSNLSEIYLLEQWKSDCKDQEGCQQIINSHLPYLTQSLQNLELRQLALDIIQLLTVEQKNRHAIAQTPNLMDQIEKLRIGSLSQKKLADEVYERLLDAFLLGQAMDIGVPFGDKENVPIGADKKPTSRQAKIVARPGADNKSKTASPSEKTSTTTSTSSSSTQSSFTVNLFVENMDEKILTEIESCLLKCKGVISFFSDVDDGKIVVRLSSENITDDVIGNIYDTTKHRTSVIKGDYDSSGYPLYISDNPNKKGEGGFFSSLYQIVSVSEVHTHPRDKNAKGGWLGSWW